MSGGCSVCVMRNCFYALLLLGLFACAEPAAQVPVRPAAAEPSKPQTTAEDADRGKETAPDRAVPAANPAPVEAMLAEIKRKNSEIRDAHFRLTVTTPVDPNYLERQAETYYTAPDRLLSVAKTVMRVHRNTIEKIVLDGNDLKYAVSFNEQVPRRGIILPGESHFETRRHCCLYLLDPRKVRGLHALALNLPGEFGVNLEKNFDLTIAEDAADKWVVCAALKKSVQDAEIKSVDEAPLAGMTQNIRFEIDKKNGLPRLITLNAPDQAAGEPPLFMFTFGERAKIHLKWPDRKSDLDITANVAGPDGNAIGIELIDPRKPDQDLALTLDGQTIRVVLATANNGEIVSTTLDVVNTINGHDAAAALVRARIAKNVDGFGRVGPTGRLTLKGGDGVRVNTGATPPDGFGLTTEKVTAEYDLRQGKGEFPPRWQTSPVPVIPTGKKIETVFPGKFARLDTWSYVDQNVREIVLRLREEYAVEIDLTGAANARAGREVMAFTTAEMEIGALLKYIAEANGLKVEFTGERAVLDVKGK